MDWKTLKINAQLRNNQSSFKREISNNRNRKILPKHYQLSSKLIRLFKSFNKRPRKKCIVSRSESYAQSSDEEGEEGDSDEGDSDENSDENSDCENSDSENSDENSNQ